MIGSRLSASENRQPSVNARAQESGASPSDVAKKISMFWGKFRVSGKCRGFPSLGTARQVFHLRIVGKRVVYFYFSHSFAFFISLMLVSCHIYGFSSPFYFYFFLSSFNCFPLCPPCPLALCLFCCLKLVDTFFLVLSSSIHLLFASSLILLA